MPQVDISSLPPSHSALAFVAVSVTEPGAHPLARLAEQ